MRSKINTLCTNLYQTPISTNGAKKTWIQATRFLHANEENKTRGFEIVNDSDSLSYLQTDHDLSNRRKFAT